MTTFKEAELAGWTEKADAYDAHLASITRQAIQPCLSVIGQIAGLSILDMCCGTGEFAAVATQHGATVTGVDFAPTMIEIASKKVPQASFVTGDAEDLGLEDATFDGVICMFGLLHLARPDRAIAEAARVLKPGGIFVYTMWKGGDLINIVVQAVNNHGSTDNFPPSPPLAQFTDEAEMRPALSALGFSDIVFREAPAMWTGKNGQEVLDLVYRASVRLPMMIEAQPPAVRDAIRGQIVEQSEALRREGAISMSWPFAVVSAKRL